MNIKKRETVIRGKISQACVKVDEWLYFSDDRMNGLFRTNIEDGSTEFIGLFGEEGLNTDIHCLAFRFENELWFIPSFGGKKVAIYNLFTGTMEYILMSRDEKSRVRWFEKYIIVGDRAWLIPCGYEKLVEIDLIGRKITYFEDESISREEGRQKFSDALFWQDKIYMCPAYVREMVIFDTRERTFEKKIWSYNPNVYRNMLGTVGKIIFFPRNPVKNPILILELSTDEYAERNIKISDDIEIGDIGYTGVVEQDSKIWMLPFDGKDILEIEMSDWSICVIKSIERESDLKYYRPIVDHQYTIMVSDSMETPVIIKEDDIKMLIAKRADNWDVSIRQWSDYNGSKEISLKNKEKQNIGSLIYESVMSKHI